MTGPSQFVDFVALLWRLGIARVESGIRTPAIFTTQQTDMRISLELLPASLFPSLPSAKDANVRYQQMLTSVSSEQPPPGCVCPRDRTQGHDPAAMVETPPGWGFEDIQYEDITVEAVNRSLHVASHCAEHTNTTDTVEQNRNDRRARTEPSCPSPNEFEFTSRNSSAVLVLL